jgi:hypothetical protein
MAFAYQADAAAILVLLLDWQLFHRRQQGYVECCLQAPMRSSVCQKAGDMLTNRHRCMWQREANRWTLA